LCNNLSVARCYVFFAALLFGTTGTAQALGPSGVSPLSVGAARVVVGGAALAFVSLALPGVRVRLSPALVVVAGASIAAYQLAFFESVHRAGVAVAAVVAIGTARLHPGFWSARSAAAGPGGGGLGPPRWRSPGSSP
jgi:drug/metabolite transporter, DME family